MRRWRAGARSVWQAFWRADRLDAAMDEEMRFHIEMEAERFCREQGLDAQEARRRAHVAFGGVEKYKQRGRDVRGLQWIDALSLDCRLGVRMLVKHRGLTLVGGFAMAVAIAIAAMGFEFLTETMTPALPMEDGERIVSLQVETGVPGSPERRVLHDFVAWRNELVSVEQLGAFRTAQHNLVSGNEPPEPIRVAEITAAGFAIARTPPLHGRYLLPSDEHAAATPVLVIGHRAWQSRFGGDPQIVGRTVTLAGTPSVVVGVMPEGFAFPVDHQYWMPLRLSPLEYERLQGPDLFVFGRLAPRATTETAQAELTAIGRRAAAEHPLTQERLRPVVLPYTRAYFNLEAPIRVWGMRMAQLLVGALAFVVSVNLAILIYARTVTRLGEIAVRTALGASRRRILAQLFIEAFALSVVGAAAGLVLASIALARIESLLLANGTIPFWMDLHLSAATAVYALALAALAAVIMGVLPGLEATGRRLNARLQELSGRTGTRLGPLWTTLVVAQVAAAVAVLPVSVYLAGQVVYMELAGPGFAAEEFVVGAVTLSDDASAVDASRVRERHLELMSRLAAEPGVSAVTFSSSIPGFAPGRMIQLEVPPTSLEAGGPAGKETATLEVSTLDVDLEMFDAYGAELLAGRTFTAGDLGAARSVVVNRTFAQEILGSSAALDVGRSPLGVRFRYVRRLAQAENRVPQEWYQVVGVVGDFPSFPRVDGSIGEPTVYHPAPPGQVHPFTLSVRFSGAIPAGFIQRFREIGAEVDPALQLRRVVPLASFYGELRSFWRYLAWGVGLMTASVLLLSAAGIYALMSFTVTRRTREIGIRSALGAAPGRLLLGIFGRVTGQLALGVLVGSLLSGAVFANIEISLDRAAPLLLIVAASMLLVGLLAALGPARRGLRIQASEALRADN